jgi:hypothetical protein
MYAWCERVSERVKIRFSVRYTLRPRKELSIKHITEQCVFPVSCTIAQPDGSMNIKAARHMSDR